MTASRNRIQCVVGAPCLRHCCHWSHDQTFHLSPGVPCPYFNWFVPRFDLLLLSWLRTCAYFHIKLGNDLVLVLSFYFAMYGSTMNKQTKMYKNTHKKKKKERKKKRKKNTRKRRKKAKKATTTKKQAVQQSKQTHTTISCFCLFVCSVRNFQ